MDELKQIIAELEQQELSFQNDLNNAIDDDQAQTIVNELNIVRNKLSKKRHELQQLQEKEQARAEVIEERVHAEEIPLAIAGIDFTELPAEVITLIDAVVKADRRRLLNEHAIELEQLENDRHADIQAKIREYNELEEQFKRVEQNESYLASEVERIAKEWTEDIGQLNEREAELEDVRSKLANAVAQIEEKDDIIAHMKAEIEDLKRAQEYNNRQTEQVTVNDDEKASITAALAAVKKLYTNKEDWGSAIKVDKPDGTFELVKRKEFEAEWSPVDVPSFRPEDTDANTTSDQLLITETSTTLEPPAFREEEPDVQADLLLREGTAEDASPVSRAEFEARMTNVEKGMETLMRKVFGEVAA